MPGYKSEVHHIDEWAKCRTTDVNKLTFACGQDHALVEPGGWKTRKRANGDTEWIPPPHSPASGRYPHDHGQPRTNSYHHPEKLLCDSDDEDDP